MTEVPERTGIAAGGNWIVDIVKDVDHLPGRGMLGSIVSQSSSTGGAAANVLLDLARMEAGFPLVGLGVVGRDEDGRFVLDRARRAGVDASLVAQTGEAGTSYTDVMNEVGTGERQFFHYRGANARFGPEHVPVESLRCRIFHLGYLLLLDRMDGPDEEHGTVAARLLRDLRAAGVRTSVDVVSEESDRFTTIVPPALRHTDYLILNEIEAARTVGGSARATDGTLDPDALIDAVDRLAELGEMELIVVHMPEGFYARDRRGDRYSRGSLELPDGFVKASVGAGDAFCAGVLHGLHEGRGPADAAWLGTCAAAACLSANNASDGLRPIKDCLALGDEYPERPAPVSVP
ncbi:MAG: carbohydrate kinase family protein [bacterium]